MKMVLSPKELEAAVAEYVRRNWGVEAVGVHFFGSDDKYLQVAGADVLPEMVVQEDDSGSSSV